jgi:hypothetical protein
MDEAIPRQRSAKDLMVRDCSEVRTAALDRQVRGV